MGYLWQKRESSLYNDRSLVQICKFTFQHFWSSNQSKTTINFHSNSWGLKETSFWLAGTLNMNITTVNPPYLTHCLIFLSETCKHSFYSPWIISKYMPYFYLKQTEWFFNLYTCLLCVPTYILACILISLHIHPSLQFIFDICH